MVRFSTVISSVLRQLHPQDLLSEVPCQQRRSSPQRKLSGPTSRRHRGSFGWTYGSGTKERGVGFAEICRFLAHCYLCIVWAEAWPTICPLATSPCVSALSVGLNSICCFKSPGKDEKPLVQKQGVSVQTAMCIPMSKLLCDLFQPISANFHKFPRLSATFRDFPRLSAIFRDFPPISATFRTFRWRSRNFSGNFLRNFRDFSKCSVHCVSVVALRSGACGARLQRTM